MKRMIYIAVLLLVLAGCGKKVPAPATAPATEPVPVETLPAPAPTEAPMTVEALVGPWYLDTAKNDMADLRVLFGTSMASGTSLEVRSNGQIGFSLGAGAGGSGSYSFDGSALHGQFITYSGSEELACDFAVVKEGDALWLAQSIYDTTIYWTQEEPAFEASVPDAYGAVLDLYNKALYEGWDDERCRNGGVNYLMGSGLTAENVGWCTRDVDGDGSPELLIGSVGKPYFYALYTLVDGQPKQVVDATERSGWCIEPDNILVNDGSNSAFEHITMFYWLKNGRLELNNGIIADYHANEGAPYFLTTDLDDSRDNDTKLSNEKAEELLKAYSSNYVVLDYAPFSQYAAG